MQSGKSVGEKRLLDLSISVVNWNTKDILRNCLKSIYVSTHKIDYEIFVVDNGSSDGSPEMVENEFPQVNLMRNTENLGFAKANNQAIELSNGRYILLLNSDTIVLDGALGKMVEFMGNHPDAGAAGCRLLNPDGSLQKSIGNFPTLLSAYWANSLLRKIFPRIVIEHIINDPQVYLQIREVDWMFGAFLILRKNAIKLVGSLDERFFMYAEEIDLCYRLKRKGWKIYFCPTTRVVHLRERSAKKIENDRTAIRKAKGMYYYYRKRYGFVGLLLTRSFSAFCSGRRLLTWCIAYLLLSTRRHETWKKIKIIWFSFKISVCPMKKYDPRNSKERELRESLTL